MREVDVDVAVVAGEAAGRPEDEPAGGLISASFIRRGIEEALGHEHRVTVSGRPGNRRVLRTFRWLVRLGYWPLSASTRKRLLCATRHSRAAR